MHATVANARAIPGPDVGIAELWPLVVGPAVLGVIALVVGVVLVRRPRPDGARRFAWFFGVFLLLVAFGIAGCYVTMFFG